MTTEESSNSKLPGYPASYKQISDTQIFPGIGKETTENFITLFPLVNRWIKHHDLTPFLSDTHNTKIPKKSDAGTAVNRTRENLVQSYFTTQMKKMKEKHRVDFLHAFKTNSLDIYLGQNLKIPQMVVLGFDTGGKAQAALHNRRNIAEEEITLNKNDPVVTAFIAADFLVTTTTFQEAAAGEVITPTTMEERLSAIGQTEALETYIANCNTREATASTRYEKQIKNLMLLFNTIIGSVSSQIMVLVNNHEFASAWTSLIHHWVVARDDTYVILQLELNLLTCTYNTTKHSDFMEYYNSLHTHYSLLLYKLWHQHFSFEQIKEMVDVMTDIGISTQHQAIMEEKNLSIPPIISEQRRMIQLLAGVKGSHLHDAQQLFQILNPQLSDTRMVDLKRTLIKADSEMAHKRQSATLQHMTLGSSVPQSSEDKCKMCILLKETYSFSNLKGHATGTPCPPNNITIMTKYFDTNPHVSGKAQGAKTEKKYGNAPKYGDSRGPNPNQSPGNLRSPPLLQPPAGFDPTIKCIHCYRSWQHGGRDSQTRGQEWENHGSANCKLSVKYNSNLPYHAHQSQLVAPATQQRDDNYADGSRTVHIDRDGRNQERGRSRGPIGGYAYNTGSGKRSRSRSRGDSSSPQRYRDERVTRLPSPPSTHEQRRDRNRDTRGDSRDRDNRGDSY